MENLFDFNPGDIFDEINSIGEKGNEITGSKNEKTDSEQIRDVNELIDNIKNGGTASNVSSDGVDLFDDIVKEVINPDANNIDENENEDEEQDVDNEETQTKRRSSNANKAIKKLIDKGVLAPFEDNEDISKYNADDIAELIEANIEEIKRELSEKKIDELFNDMPEELKILNKYYLEGGTDIRSMLNILNKMTDIKNLTLGEDDEMIVKLYLKHTNYGTDEEIEEEIEALKKANILNDRAIKYKKKLDEINEEIVKKQLEEQKKEDEKKQKIVEEFITNVKRSLADGKINDININTKKINELINGLTVPNYDSISGKKTNKLGYLLEKYQFVEPNIKLVSEALWLLSNPDEYKNTLIEKGKQMAMEEVRKELKTEAQRTVKNSTMYGGPEDTNLQKSTKKTIKRNFFDRNF